MVNKVRFRTLAARPAIGLIALQHRLFWGYSIHRLAKTCVGHFCDQLRKYSRQYVSQSSKKGYRLSWLDLKD